MEQFGRLFALADWKKFGLNFLHCMRENLFRDVEMVRVALTEWWSECATSDVAAAGAGLQRAAFKPGRQWGHPVQVDGRNLCKVVSFQNFYDSAFGMFNRAYVQQHLADAKKDPLDNPYRTLAQFEAFQRDPRAIRQGVLIRSSIPVAWVTIQDAIDGIRERFARGERSGDLAMTVCERLGLDLKHYLRQPVFVLSYPDAAIGEASQRGEVRRATAFEGFANAYFRAATDGVYPDGFGRTVDLLLIRDRHAGVDGLPEMILPPLPFGTGYSWAGLGVVPPRHEPIDDDRFINLAAGEMSPDDAIMAAIVMIREYCGARERDA